jgi:hypothetical protein
MSASMKKGHWAAISMRFKNIKRPPDFYVDPIFRVAG